MDSLKALVETLNFPAAHLVHAEASSPVSEFVRYFPAVQGGCRKRMLPHINQRYRKRSRWIRLLLRRKS